MNGASDGKPIDDTPLRSWNVLVPALLLIIFIFYFLIVTGTKYEASQTFVDKLQSSDSFSALLLGSMAASLCTMSFYFMQIVKYGQLILPSWSVLMGPILRRRQRGLENQGELSPRSLMSISASTDAFLSGMGKVFPALIILTLAWACGAIMIQAGADRLVARIISNRVDPRYLPTILLVLSFIITPALGSSWGTLSIMIPLLLVPAYKTSNGDPAIVYATIGALLSGGVAGDQISPISDTCVVSALACSCDLLNHVSTQAPYVAVVTLFSILLLALCQLDAKSGQTL